MKKLMSALLIAMLVFCFAACGSDETTGDEPQGSVDNLILTSGPVHGRNSLR